MAAISKAVAQALERFNSEVGNAEKFLAGVICASSTEIELPDLATGSADAWLEFRKQGSDYRFHVAYYREGEDGEWKQTQVTSLHELPIAQRIKVLNSIPDFISQAVQETESIPSVIDAAIERLNDAIANATHVKGN